MGHPAQAQVERDALLARIQRAQRPAPGDGLAGDEELRLFTRRLRAKTGGVQPGDAEQVITARALQGHGLRDSGVVLKFGGNDEGLIGWND